MGGSVASIIGSVKKAATAPTNFIVNGSFDTAVTSPPWVVGSGVPTRSTARFHSAPASGLNGSDADGNSSVYYSANSVLTIGSYYSLSLWVYFANVGANTTLYYSTGFNASSISVSATAGVWSYVKIENQLCTSATSLSFQLYDLNSLPFYVDDIWVVSGATAH